MKSIKILACMGILLPLAVGPALAQSNIMFILDGSNSMWGQVDGVAKIETAKKALSGMLLDLPVGTKAGLMAYGHTRKEDCTDVQVLASIGSTDAKSLTSMLQGIVPKGKTPITVALEKSFHQFSSLEQSNAVVLVSDGIETCGGDPCKTAGELAKRGLNVKKVHVVGFDVNEEARQQLECIATVTGGKYFQANSTEGFKKAIYEVKKEVQTTQTALKPAGPKEVFRDDFDGENLGEHWGIENPNPDSFIMEDGNLLVINSTPADFAKGNIGNLFRLNKPLPKGDWTATAKIRVEFQSLSDRVFFGLYNDKKNYLINVLSLGFDPNSAHHILFVSSDRALKGKITTSSTRVWNTGIGSGIAGVTKGQPYLLRFEKKGREYTGSIKLEGINKPQWIALPSLRLLRSKGNLSIGVFQAPGGTGEVALNVDWVKIEVPGK